ncbi:hypothetical protein M9H77_30448 [Catharanthus roseus]|uniref:Uncharacterized protein n=1 Tax=Catharanthus roseus TaxID=4058 RepID=A0ACB9ZXM9_CATRO|nr:hypothetical protein M9H77_30448 [Catharanthus roseus]
MPKHYETCSRNAFLSGMDQERMNLKEHWVIAMNWQLPPVVSYFEKLTKILLFFTIINQILTMNPFPSVDYAHNMIIHEEGHCVVARDQDVWDEVEIGFLDSWLDKQKFGNSGVKIISILADLVLAVSMSFTPGLPGNPWSATPNNTASSISPRATAQWSGLPPGGPQ